MVFCLKGEKQQMDIILDTERRENAVIVNLQGEIDLYNARNFKDKINEEMDDVAEGTNLLLNMLEVKYIDSTGLGILIGIKRRIAERGGDVVLIINSERILKMFSITGLSNIFRIRETVDSAIEVLKG